MYAQTVFLTLDAWRLTLLGFFRLYVKTEKSDFFSTHAQMLLTLRLTLRLLLYAIKINSMEFKLNKNYFFFQKKIPVSDKIFFIINYAERSFYVYVKRQASKHSFFFDVTFFLWVERLRFDVKKKVLMLDAWRNFPQNYVKRQASSVKIQFSHTL